MQLALTFVAGMLFLPLVRAAAKFLWLRSAETPLNMQSKERMQMLVAEETSK